jgi:hypothetical protein
LAAWYVALTDAGTRIGRIAAVVTVANGSEKVTVMSMLSPAL